MNKVYHKTNIHDVSNGVFVLRPNQIIRGVRNWATYKLVLWGCRSSDAVKAESHYSLRSRPHDRQLIPKLTKPYDSNFIVRMLYKQVYWHSISCCSFFLFVWYILHVFFTVHDAFCHRDYRNRKFFLLDHCARKTSLWKAWWPNVVWKWRFI